MKEYCREILEAAYLYIDGEGLTEAQRLTIEEHLMECAPCFDRVGVEREVVTIIARLRGSTRCPDHVKHRIANLLDEA
jgi:mycothiol system anti-sigma-R factor